nr:PREDICTED: insulin-like growth factor-binding protein 7 [Balearica regulorum gibbericeps]
MEAEACECSQFILQSLTSSWLDQDVHPKLELRAASQRPGSRCAVAAALSQPELHCEAVQAVPLSREDKRFLLAQEVGRNSLSLFPCQPLLQEHPGVACSRQGPSIVTPPKDIWNVTGAQIYLSCEVIGIPTPVLIWNKIIRGQYGVQRMELLPGDRENLAIQTRGGPEKHEVTGWVLISPLSKEDAGEYECHASNAKGEATASAKIHVVETLHEIALTKDDGAEL